VKVLGIKHKCTVNGVLVGLTAIETVPESEARGRAKDMMIAERRLKTTEVVSEVVGCLAAEGSRW
jgi:hypothetical protein